MSVCQLEWRVLGPNLNKLSEVKLVTFCFRDIAVHVLLVTLEQTQGVPCRHLRNKAVATLPVFSTIITSKRLA